MPAQYESIQLVAFLLVPPTGDALAIWMKVIGQTPSSFSTQAPGVTQAQGVVGTHIITLLVQATRVDVIVAADPAGGHTATPPALVDLDSALQLALARMHDVVPMLKVGRAAAVIQGHTVCATGPDTVVELLKSLPGVRVPKDAADLTYQVVTPYSSPLMPSRKINQLCRWQTVQMQLLQIQPTSIGMTTPVAITAHTYIDVYGVDMEQLSDGDALAAVDEVATRAKQIMLGGLNELG